MLVTLSPTANSDTPSPNAVTTPAPSDIGMRLSAVFNWPMATT